MVVRCNVQKSRTSSNVKVKVQGQHSPGTKNALSAADAPRYVRIVSACCIKRATAADGPISWLPRGVFWGLRAVYVW